MDAGSLWTALFITTYSKKDNNKNIFHTVTKETRQCLLCTVATGGVTKQLVARTSQGKLASHSLIH